MTTHVSTLEGVTVYREGAVCERRVVLAAGVVASAQVRVTGLPLSLSPGSMRARLAKGPEGLRVLDVRAGWDVVLAEAIDEPAEKKAMDAARDEASRLRLTLSGLEAEIAELEGLRPSFPVQKKGAPPREAPIAAMVALSDFSDASLAVRLERRRALTRELEDADEAVRLREQRLREASTALRTERSRLSRSVTITVSEPAGPGVEFFVEYQVPGARWAPGYQLRLDQGLGGGALRMRAVVAQGTGEDWTAVRLSLSTASLLRRTDAPELMALKIGRSQPPPPRSGWREPPAGLDELFAAYDDALALGALAAPRQASDGAPPRPKGGKPKPEAEKKRKKADRREEALGGLAPQKSAASFNAPMPPSGGAVPPGAARGGFGGAPPAPPPPPMAASMPAPMMKEMARMRSAPRDLDQESTVLRRPSAPREEASDELSAAPEMDEGGGGGGLVEPSPADEGIALDAGLLDYDRLVLPSSATDRASRGRLRPASAHEFMFVAGLRVEIEVVMAFASRALSGAMGVASLGLPGLYQPVTSLESFDYRFDCEQRADVPSTGAWVTVPVMACDVGLVPEYVCVPSVEPKVYRTLQVKNASAHALLAGPVDVSAGDEFLLTAALPAIAPGSTEARLGLGVEEAIKVARKTHYKESTGGFLGGSTVLPHEVEVEINNRLGSPARVEVRERVPVPEGSEKDVKVEETSQAPAWEKLETPLDGVVTPGLRRWRVTVPPGQKQTLTAQYTIRIPADRMLVGGNRRA